MAVMTKRLTDSVIFAYPTFLPWYLIGWRPKVGHHVFKKQEWKKGFRNLKKRDKLSKSIILTGVSKHLHEFSKENFRTLNGKF